MLLLALIGCDSVLTATEASLGAADPTAPLQVYALRGGPGAWRRDPAPFAHAFSSLHAVSWGDDLVLAGLSSARPPSWLDERFPRLAVGALVTRDGATWAARSYAVDAPGTSLIDPALVAGPEGMELWFVQAEGLGDPAQGGRTVDIVRTRWNGARFDRAETWATARGLVDPAPVWFGGGWHVFATRDHAAVVVLDAKGGSAREVLGGASVPFARTEGDEVVLLAQRPTGGGRMVPIELRSRDMRQWSAPRTVVDDPSLQTCASPVTGRLAGAELLFCVDERR